MSLCFVILVSFLTQIAGKCPDDFIAIKDVCVTQFVDFSRKGSFLSASKFCKKFNPEGYRGELWKIDIDDLLTSSFITLLGKQEELQHAMQVWNGLGNSDFRRISPESSDKCIAVGLSDGVVVPITSSCERKLPFICALRSFEKACSDSISSEMCLSDVDLFCNRTKVLRNLCKYTCEDCELMENPCEQKVEIWDEEKCEKLAQQGHCERAVDNVRAVCSKACCKRDDLESYTKRVFPNSCEALQDSVECPKKVDFSKCFQDAELTSNCIKSCCLTKFNASFKPQKRKTNFLENIMEHHCRFEFDDIFPFSVCRDADACSAKKRKYCEATCCLRDENVAITTFLPTSSSEETTTLPEMCEGFENIYADLICQIVQSAEDCEDLGFRKHCKKRCCLLGYVYATETTTIDPENPCSEFFDGGEHCGSVNNVDDCQLNKYSDCEYTCCQQGQISTTTETATTTELVTEENCQGKKDLIAKCSKVKDVGLCSKEPFLTGCPYTCCMLGSLVATTSSATTSVVDIEDCDKFEDLSAKCASATNQKCLKEPYIRNCKCTCCRLRLQTTTTESSTTEVTRTTANIEQCAAKYEDTLAKCNKITSKDDCVDEPFFSRCKCTCCVLGFEYQSTTTDRVSTTSEVSTISGDICTDTEDLRTKCYLLQFEPDPVKSCKNVNFYKLYCHLSCCLAKYKASQTTVVTTTVTQLNCNELQDQFNHCEMLNLNEILCQSHTFETLCALSCCIQNGGSVHTTTEPLTITKTAEITTTSSGGKISHLK